MHLLGRYRIQRVGDGMERGIGQSFGKQDSDEPLTDSRGNGWRKNWGQEEKDKI